MQELATLHRTRERVKKQQTVSDSNANKKWKKKLKKDRNSLKMQQEEPEKYRTYLPENCP